MIYDYDIFDIATYSIFEQLKKDLGDVYIYLIKTFFTSM
jgi:hypothetical protein